MAAARFGRRVLAGLLVAVSLIPVAVTLPILGGGNVLFLAVLWIALFTGLRMMPLGLSLALALICALAMAIPPVPNYLSPSSFHLQFIGWQEILNDPYGLTVFFVFYLVLFGAVVLLVGRRQRRASVQ